MVIKSWQEKAPVSTLKSQSFLDLEFSKDDTFLFDDKQNKDIMKRLRELEDITRKKLSQNDNLVNLLMENQ